MTRCGIGGRTRAPPPFAVPSLARTCARPVTNVYLGLTRFDGHLLRAAKRLFGIPDFRLYALADGIREVCARSPRRSKPPANAPPQLTLGFG